MNVWRKQTVRYLLDGKSVRKGTTGTVAERELSKRFYGTLRLANGKRKQVSLTEERKTSQTLLRRLQTEADTARANRETRFTLERKRPVNELLAAYETHLRDKGNTSRNVSEAVYRIHRLFTATNPKTLTDIESAGGSLGYQTPAAFAAGWAASAPAAPSLPQYSPHHLLLPHSQPVLS